MITFREESLLLCKNFDRTSELRNILICCLFNSMIHSVLFYFVPKEISHTFLLGSNRGDFFLISEVEILMRESPIVQCFNWLPTKCYTVNHTTEHISIDKSHPWNLNMKIFQSKFLDAWAGCLVWRVIVTGEGIYEYILWNLGGYFDRLKEPQLLTDYWTLSVFPPDAFWYIQKQSKQMQFGQITFWGLGWKQQTSRRK